MNPKLICGDALEQLKLLGDNTIDALVTDPPAGIGFMGKEWDHHKGGRDEWIKWLRSIMEEALRVLKPGGHGLVWALPRTSHWTATALEDAGFEVRDCVYHVFGSGFPKSLNVGKAIDKLQGNEREIVGTQMLGGNAAQTTKEKGGTYASNTDAIGVKPIEVQLTKGSTVWEGWGTALKPAVECWWLVRKPLGESTVAKNVLEYGTGALNIDASRIGFDPNSKEDNHAKDQWERQARSGVKVFNQEGDAKLQSFDQKAPSGRWPSHLIHDGSDEVLEHFPQTHKAGNLNLSNTTSDKSVFGIGAIGPRNHDPFGDSGSAARFFKTCEPSLRHDSMSLCKHLSANIVAKVLMTIQATPDLTAPSSVADLRDEQLDQNVKSATTGCQKCVTPIAQELVRIKNSASNPEGLQAIQDSIGNFGNSILTQNLVEIVGKWVSTDTTPTTTDLLTLFGSVLLAIDENTSSTKKVAVGVDSDQVKGTRLLYAPKPSKAERNAKLNATHATHRNFHPTVKGQALMRYLITLITPPEGIVLDMFMGSGSTGVAAKALGHSFVGIELDPEYFKIAQARITKTKVGEPLEYDPPVTVDENQLELFETGENHNERTLH